MNKQSKKPEPAVDAVVSGSVCEIFSEEITNGMGGFKVWEDREFVVHSDRDRAIVEWTIRCLANPDNPLTGRVLHEITMQRLRESGHKVASAVDAVDMCKTERESWDCHNMKETYSDMDKETWECQKEGCKMRYKLYYDEMR